MTSTPTQTRRPRGRRFVRFSAWSLAGLLILALLAALAGWTFMRASLPQLDGRQAAPGLRASAAIVRDADGNATITAAHRDDAAYATGFAHGQDRFFQMDMMRRLAAGELAALVGPSVLPLDRRNRLHRFRERAAAAYGVLDDTDQHLLRRYADGVNDALAAARARPVEYLVLGAAPKPWEPEDSLLAIDAMYLNLQGMQMLRLLSRGALREQVPADLLAFLTPRASHWDATLDDVEPNAMIVLPPTRPDWLDPGPGDLPAVPRAGIGSAVPLEAFIASSSGQPSARDELIAGLLASAGLDPASATGWRQDAPAAVVGSSGFAVDGRHGAQGLARVGNDMHLGLTLPNIWYRLTLEFPDRDAPGRQRRVSGVSLPGTPAVVAGSNGDVAWGFTNSYGQFMDLVAVERDPSQPRRYLGPASEWETAREYTETIAVKGQPDVTQTVYETRWGPILEADGRAYAVRWVAYQAGATDLGLLGLEEARDVPRALRIAQGSGVPTQNILVAGRDGRIGWTLAGPLPLAVLDPNGFPVSASQVDAPAGRLAPQAYPAIIDPPGGRLWSGNSTQLGDPARQRLIGDGGADVGARATQIRDNLRALPEADNAALLAVQLDDRARWIAPWSKLVLDTLDEDAVRDHPQRAAYRRLVAEWNGRADIDAVGYTLLRGLHDAFQEAWFGRLDKRLADSAPSLSPSPSVARASSRLEAVMEVLMRERAWIPSRHADWRDFVLDRIDTVIAANTANGARLENAYWGKRNRLAMGHPFARLLPASVRGWLSAPTDAMPGDVNNMPRIQHPSFGASERFVVAPGHENEGILHMPGGASGHLLSPFFLAGHQAWVEGRPTPFLPGPAAHRLELVPAP
ncbi:beta-lactam antibiotic acylase [Bordetella ansorpii]|uniref:Beta-lactam antibiotic acylase n=1 Tax=Bordetella ansorpii TaxID=288768 RepID=A0A157STD7_9BORD|nr:penicillin acylase family protein [Bordetella ansorpii]SAI73730.1 beta-lactam antibiotic acylase [Bordetella ansorpii]